MLLAASELYTECIAVCLFKVSPKMNGSKHAVCSYRVLGNPPERRCYCQEKLSESPPSAEVLWGSESLRDGQDKMLLQQNLWFLTDKCAVCWRCRWHPTRAGLCVLLPFSVCLNLSLSLLQRVRGTSPHIPTGGDHVPSRGSGYLLM